MIVSASVYVGLMAVFNDQMNVTYKKKKISCFSSLLMHSYVLFYYSAYCMSALLNVILSHFNAILQLGDS